MLGANLSGEVDVFRFRSSGFLVCCVSNASRSALPGKPEFSGGGGWVVVEGKVSGGGMKQSVSFLEPHRLPGEQPPPFALQNEHVDAGKEKKKKGCVRRDAESITATALHTGAPCLQVLIHLHSEVTRRRVSRRAVFLYLLNKILNAAPSPSSSSSRAPSPTIQFFRFNQRLRKPRPFPQRWLVRSACHYTVTLQMEQGIRVIKTKMQGHNS